MKRLIFSTLIAFALLFSPLFISHSFATNSGVCPSKQEGGGLVVQEKWKTKFPFDLIYPTPGATTPSNPDGCPEFEFFGSSRKMCSFGMITSAFKNVFLVKLAIDFLKNA